MITNHSESMHASRRALFSSLFAALACAVALGMFAAPDAAFAASGNFGPYLITRQGTNGDLYTAASGSISFGTVTNGTTWLLEGGELTSWADGGDSANGANLFFRAYRDGQTAPSFTSQSLGFVSQSGNDKKWAKTDLGLSLAGSTVQIDGATYNGSYSVEFYYQAVFNWGSQYNYVGTSTATTAPTTDFYKATYSLTGFDYYIDVASGSVSQSSATGGASQLTGSVGIGKYGAGTVTLDNTANDYTGRTLIAAGTLQSTAAGVIPDGSDVRIKSGAVLDLNGNNETVASVGEFASSNGGTISLGAGTLTVTANSTNVYQNSISGSGGLTKQGSHTLNLYGTQGYTGTTTVSGGTLATTVNMASTNYILSGGSTFQTSAGNQIVDAAAFTLNGASLLVYGNDTLGGDGVTISASSTNFLRAASSSTTTVNGKVTGGGTLVKYGNGGLWLNSISNDFSGRLILQAGTLRITNANSLGTAVLQMGDGTTSSTFQITNSFTRSAEISITNASTASVIDVFTNSTFTHSGNLTQIGGTANSTKFGKAGAGTLVLSGTASTYGGQIQIGQGAVIVTANNALSTNTTTANRGIDLGLNVGDVSQANNVSLLGRDGVTISNSIYVAPNTTSATRTIGVDGTGTTTFNNEIYLDGTLTVSAASGANAVVSGNIITNISGGGGGLTKTGAGTATLSGTSANTYNGATTVSEGTLALGKTAGTTSIAGSVTVASGATLLLNTSNQVADTSAVTLSGGTIKLGSAASETFGNLTVGSASSLDFGSFAGANMSFGTYSPTQKITVNNFIGLSTLVFKSDMTSFVTNSTYFSFANGYSSAVWNSGSSTFTITAIPEPSTIVAAIGLAGMMLYPLRRRFGRRH